VGLGGGLCVVFVFFFLWGRGVCVVFAWWGCLGVVWCVCVCVCGVCVCVG